MRVGTDGFVDELIGNIGEKPETIKSINYSAAKPIIIADETTMLSAGKNSEKTLVGVDLFADYENSADGVMSLGSQLEDIAREQGMKLRVITNRGVKVYPDLISHTLLTRHYRCRFVLDDSNGDEYSQISSEAIILLLKGCFKKGIDIIKTENLYLFEGKRGFSLAQGQ